MTGRAGGGRRLRYPAAGGWARARVVHGERANTSAKRPRCRVTVDCTTRPGAGHAGVAGRSLPLPPVLLGSGGSVVRNGVPRLADVCR
ncbi:hypothetical protein Daura_39655 [Dactylosporangium aurantiacum]|uniref:Uncharacterized protein n=1 Tax=Dactylosporangium aurantiacum TaxID=35754 RepID=A0A9Q9ME02_9ACTN|nr:hypothetical protein [Dactylosporangium aurantiacum]MDG6101460.1 hypothetical protein [Dactylosporangium aurantiacum]UWZ52689.1 hypothetical protein Daura_39655 [Dactylosporangium aurantiacum]